MESSSQGIPSTPSSTTLEGQSPPPRNSMEDADPSTTRKRPRLDSGDRVYQNMSADRASSTHAGLEPEQLSAGPSNGEGKHDTEDVHQLMTTPPLDGTPSKMTINVRDSTIMSSPTHPAVSNVHISQDVSPAAPSTMAQATHTAIAGSPPPGFVTISSSPPQSPKIEVAELEDMDGHNGPTVWHTSSTAVNLENLQVMLLDEFPMADQCNSLVHAVQTIQQSITYDDLGDGRLILEIAEWIERYLEQTELAVSQWWNMFTEAREFWEKLPTIIDALVRRTNKFSDTFIKLLDLGENDKRQYIADILVAYAALTARMLRIDCQTLQENAEDSTVTPDLVSPRYVQIFYYIPLGVRDLPLWKMLSTTYDYDVGNTAQSVYYRFLGQPCSGLEYLSQYTELVMDRSQNQTSMVAELWTPLSLTNRLTNYRYMFTKNEGTAEVSSPPVEAIISTEALRFFQVVDAKLQSFVTKQVSALSLDLSKMLVYELSAILRQIVFTNITLGQSMLPPSYESAHDLTGEERSCLIEYTWRSGLFKKCIMQGRMEIRVQGVEGMQEDLVAIYQRFIAHPKTNYDHPVVDYLSRFLLDNKFVNYLVGVDSHPQLIQRSKNIVGFLVVTNKYTETESDIIWGTVSSSQDSRTIDAILEMLSGILGIMKYPTLLYICHKLNNLSIRYFDTRMITFCRMTLELLRKQWDEILRKHWAMVPTQKKLDVHPYHLCIRLLRQATGDSSLNLGRKREVFQFAVDELHSLMKLGPSDSDCNILYNECITDIRERSTSATGSIAAINIFLDHKTEDEIAVLATNSNIASLIIGEFAHFTEAESVKTSEFQDLSDSLAVRLNLLQKIIVLCPSTIDSELGQTLWVCMLGDKALGDHARDAAWVMLAKATHNSIGRNSFLDKCVREYLPRLDPLFFTWAVLPFAEKVIKHESCFTRSVEDSEDDGLAVPGRELLWHLALAVPHRDIGSKSIGMLVKINLDTVGNQWTRLPATDETHTRLVERCISQLIASAAKLKRLSDGTSSGEDDSMIIVASEKEIFAEKLYFSRSLSILKEFMQAIRSRLPDSPLSVSSYHSPHITNGDKIIIRYQSYSGGSSTGIRTIEIGDLATFEDLINRLIKVTGFSKFTAIAGGQRLDQTNNRHATLRDFNVHQKGLLIIKKAPDADSVRETTAMPALRPLESEVMKHFHELYELLAIEESLGKDVFDFLVTFPPHEDIKSMVCREDHPASEAFPPEAPYKTLYSVHALKACLSQQLQDGASSQDLICHGVRCIVSALLEFGFRNPMVINQVEIMIATGLVNCLLRFLKEPVPFEVSATYFENPSALIDRLRYLIVTAQSLPSTPESSSLIQACFCTMLEASMKRTSVWQCFKDHSSTPSLLRNLLLESASKGTREGAVIAIRGVCSVLPTPAETNTQEFVSFFWESFVTTIPLTTLYHTYAQQFFEVALDVFRRIDMNSQADLPLASYLQDWSRLLLEHKHDEFVGRDCVDWIVSGLTGLLHWCIQLMKSKKKPLTIDGNLVKGIFQTHLFPDPHDGTTEVAIKARVPVTHSATRGRLYSVLLSLCTDLGEYQKLLDLVKALFSQGEESQAWSWGIAQILEDYQYDANWNFERMKSIRSPTGYPGLRNLSNTCYLNSLFTQLFMNVRFRSFMLSMKITDSHQNQRLLYETKRLFAYMQETWLKSVDPQGIADSVVTYEGSQIDVSIQMDVDEFYNLLFDRWESQIPATIDKKTFRQFYGGQIVQQIKSKECPHISERLEPFSAIQCEIQGKGTLAESLNAYIEGEVMEGDNKYSCSSCGCYVNAVKRACLKDIPENLIFHLKRFDYDVVSGLRSKINDHFEFPEEINMSPYDVEYLKDPSQAIAPDVFKLVGVLVHSGTAESGHYYTYVRERPCAAGDGNWVEYNDADVTRFDPCHIPEQCYGGLSEPVAYSPMRFPKTWNAYMLFYQRISSMDAEREMHMPLSADTPVKEVVPTELSNTIAVDNEKWIQKFCLFDPEHAKFTKLLLEQYRDLSKGNCSDNHDLEREVICVALEHLDQILSKAKDCPEFYSVLDILVKIVSACPECCKITLDWVANQDFALRNLLLRCPDEEIRQRFSKMIVGALKFLRNHDSRLYGLDVDGGDSDSSPTRFLENRGAFHDVVEKLKELWSYMHQHSRAWDNYYGLLHDLAQLGWMECHLMHEEGFLTQCLEILIIDSPNLKSLRASKTQHGHYCRLLEKGRKFSLRNLISLLAALLKWADLDSNFADYSSESDLSPTHKYTISAHEDACIRFGSDAQRSSLKVVYFLDKALSQDNNMQACQELVRILVQAELRVSMHQAISRTIFSGVNIEPASLARPYLQAALAFCEACPSQTQAHEMITKIAGEVETIGNSGGEEHLEFFIRARRLWNDRISRKNPNFFHHLVLQLVPNWAPTLLIYPDNSVRDQTIHLLHGLVFSHDIQAMDDEEQAELIEDTAKNLCRSCLKRISDHIIKVGKPIDGRIVEEIMRVVKHCITAYFTHEEDIEEDRLMIEESESLLDQLTALTVSSPDNALSDAWDNGSDLPTDSESELVFLSP